MLSGWKWWGRSFTYQWQASVQNWDTAPGGTGDFYARLEEQLTKYSVQGYYAISCFIPTLSGLAAQGVNLYSSQLFTDISQPGSLQTWLTDWAVASPTTSEPHIFINEAIATFLTPYLSPAS